MHKIIRQECDKELLNKKKNIKFCSRESENILVEDFAKRLK